MGVARSKEKLDQITKECGPHFIPMVCDVACNNAVENLFFLFSKQNLSIDIFFLNAGIAGDSAVKDGGFNLTKHHEIMKVNYFGVLNFVHHWMKNDGKKALCILSLQVLLTRYRHPLVVQRMGPAKRLFPKLLKGYRPVFINVPSFHLFIAVPFLQGG